MNTKGYFFKINEIRQTIILLQIRYVYTFKYTTAIWNKLLIVLK